MVKVVSTPSVSQSLSNCPSRILSSSHASTPGQRTRSAAYSGSTQRDLGVSVVYKCLHVKSLLVLCVCPLQSEHAGVGCISGDILCMHSINSGNLFALSCESFSYVYYCRVHVFQIFHC